MISPTTGPTSGGTLVSVDGNNFGPPGSTAYVTVDGDSATSVMVQSHISLTFVTPEGSGVNNEVFVTINGQTSNAALFSFLPPMISNVSPISGPEEGGTLVTLTGSNFGPVDAPTSLLIGGQPVSLITHVSHNTITFLTPPGTGVGKIIHLTIDGQSTIAPITFSYIAPDYPGVGIGTVEVEPSALLEIQSSSQGILIPRMSTAARLTIASPAEGLLVYDSTEHAFFFYNGTIWKQVGME